MGSCCKKDKKTKKYRQFKHENFNGKVFTQARKNKIQR